MAKKATKKSPAKVADPVAWLTLKLGKADAASFLKGLQKASKNIAAGKMPPAEEVEGQAPCGTYCAMPASRARRSTAAPSAATSESCNSRRLRRRRENRCGDARAPGARAGWCGCFAPTVANRAC